MTKIVCQIKYLINLSLGRVYVENKNRKLEALVRIIQAKYFLLLRDEGVFMYTKLFRLILIEFIA